MTQFCLCGARNYRQIFQGTYLRGDVPRYEFFLQQCLDCNLVRTDPLPDVTFYESGYLLDGNGEYRVRDKPWDAIIAKQLRDLLAAHPAARSHPMLDVGCNGGGLVEALSSCGIGAEGCDVDRVSVAHGAKRGLTLFCCDLTKEQLGKTYGAVSMVHTLEHILEPSPMLAHIAQAVCPGGLLYVRVPNFGGWIPRIMKQDWSFLVPSQHVWQFTPATLRLQVERLSGFRMLDLTFRTRLEPASIGWKGAIKELITNAARWANRGDEIVATFVKPL